MFSSSDEFFDFMEQADQWDTSEHESVFLGACLEYFGRKSTMDKLIKLLSLGVDETWFVCEKNRALYSGIVQASLLLGQNDAIVGKGVIVEKAEEILGVVGFALPLMKKCEKSISYFELHDFIEKDLVVWWNKLKKEEIRVICKRIEALTRTELNRERSEELSALIERAEDAWNDQPNITTKGSSIFSEARDDALKPKPENSTISTGLDGLDYVLGGGFAGPNSPEEGRLIVSMGRPGMGKSLLTTTLAMRMAMSGYKAALWSLEMRPRQVANRILAAYDFEVYGKNATEDQLTYDHIRNHELSDTAAARLTSTDYKFLDENVLVYGGGAELTAIQVCNRIKIAAKRDPTIRLFMVDHLHLLSLPGGDSVQALGEVTRLLKVTAVEIGVDVMLLCQLNRSVEQMTDKRPQLSSARGSGRIEEDADVILGLYREAYYDPSADPNKLEILALKNRQGATLSFPVRANLDCCAIYQ